MIININLLKLERGTYIRKGTYLQSSGRRRDGRKRDSQGGRNWEKLERFLQCTKEGVELGVKGNNLLHPGEKIGHD